jgi:hypothetical protein
VRTSVRIARTLSIHRPIPIFLSSDGCTQIDEEPMLTLIALALRDRRWCRALALIGAEQVREGHLFVTSAGFHSSML